LITLLAGTVARYPISEPAETEFFTYLIVAQLAYIGAHLTDRTSGRYREMHLSVPGFLQWYAPQLDLSAQQDEASAKVTIHLQNDAEKREPTILRSGDARIEFRAGGPLVATWQGSEEVTVRQEALIVISFDDERPESDFWKAATLVVNFLTFLWDQRIVVDTIWLTGPQGLRRTVSGEHLESQIEVLYAQPDFEQCRHDSSRMTAPRFDSFANFVAVWDRWLTTADRFEPVISVYLAVLHGSGSQYATSQFLSISQAIETFHRIKFEGRYMPSGQFKETVLPALVAAIPSGTSPEFVEAIKTKLTYLNEVSLRSRVRHLLESKRDTALRLGGEGFVKDFVNTRNYLVHRSSELRERALEGARLLHLTFQARFLLQVLVLTELGLNDEDIESFGSRGRWAGLEHWRWGRPG